MAYFLVEPSLTKTILFVSLGVFFLGIASSALNQIQERDVDAQMDRTKNRPLVKRTIPLTSAFLFTIFSFISGIILLWIYGSTIAMVLGVLTMLWYNGLYTWLKRKTAFAVIPGSITGAIPPIIGWTAAGGYIFDFKILLIAFIFFIGQVPHFWLLIDKYGDQYKKAGLPNLTDIFSSNQIKRLSFIWLASSLISALLLLYFNMIYNQYLKGFFLGIVTLLLIIYIIPAFSKTKKYTRKHFILLNAFYLILLLTLILNEIIL